MMRVLKSPAREEWQDLTARATRPLENAVDEIRPLMQQVREEGDAALRQLTEKFDGVRVEHFRVTPEEFEQAEAHLEPDLRAAMQVAHANITAFHEPQLRAPQLVETQPGVTCWRKSLPIQNVGLYVPGGTAPLFSTVLMLGIPARTAGCPNVVLCTPPRRDGTVHPAVLVAAKMTGIHQVYRVGGAQAIAAMMYGTESIPRVDKLFGPGNQYVTAAKQWASMAGVGVDMPAGPTELAILADGSARADFLAADVLSQAEHGPDSQVFVVLAGEGQPEALLSEIERQLTGLPRAEIARKALDNSVVVCLPEMDDAIDLINAYAGEHLIIATGNATGTASRITTAGSVFVGHLTPESAGDYASGTNHTLPTGGAARAFSGVSVDSFQNQVTFQEITEQGIRALAPTIGTLARAEELEGHARAALIRLEALPEATEAPTRMASIARQTSETDIFVRVNLDGTGRTGITTGLEFFDHMLTQIGRHGGLDLDIRVSGDLEVDEHHTVEDTAIALGQALRQALGDKRGIERYAFLLPMDEALAHVALDLGGRSHLVWDLPFSREFTGDVPTEMWEHFFKSFCDAAACNLNIKASGQNEHHQIEAVFKGFARCLRTAVARTGGNQIPSSKGTL